MSDIKLYNDDYKNILEKLEDNSVNLVVVDPPYDLSVRHDGGKLYANI